MATGDTATTKAKLRAALKTVAGVTAQNAEIAHETYHMHEGHESAASIAVKANVDACVDSSTDLTSAIDDLLTQLDARYAAHA